MKIAITKSFFKLVPSDFVWKLTKDPFMATKTCFFGLHNVGVFSGGSNPQNSFFLLKITKISLEKSFLMLES